MDALIRRFPLKRVIIPADSVIISRIIVQTISLSVLSKGMTVSMIYCRNSEKLYETAIKAIVPAVASSSSVRLTFTRLFKQLRRGVVRSPSENRSDGMMRYGV